VKEAGSAGSSFFPGEGSSEPTVTLSHEDIARALEEARAAWVQSADLEALRNALLDLLERLKGGE